LLCRPTGPVTTTERQLLTRNTLPRYAMLRGDVVCCVEVEPSGTESECTKRLLRSIRSFRPVTDNTWVHLVDEGVQRLIRRTIVFSSTEKTTMRWINVASEDWDATKFATAAELCDETKLTLPHGFLLQVNEDMGTSYSDLSEVKLLRVTDYTDATIEEWIECERAGYSYRSGIMLWRTNAEVFMIAREGGAIITESQKWNDLTIEYKGGLEHKFNTTAAINDDLERLDDGEFNIVKLTTAFSPMSDEVATAQMPVTEQMEATSRVVEVYEKETGEYEIDLLKRDDIPDAKTIDYWDQFSEIPDPSIVLPTTKKFRVTARIEPVALQMSTKVKMEPYPKFARPSMTSKFAEEMNSVTGRQGSTPQYVKRESTPELEYDMFKKNYYRKDYEKRLQHYKANPIHLDINASLAWAKKHNNPKNVIDSLKELATFGFESDPINNVKVHGKIEQTVKMDKVSRWFDEVMSRSILASAYCVSAIFSPAFIEVKKRFKDILDNKVVYSDGMTPQQMGAHASTYGDAEWVVTDDLSKQDAATTWLILNTERAIYADLGVDPGTLEMYFWIHANWRWKGRGLSGVWDAMRLTGQPTTALGNAITNLIVHNRLYMRNKHIIVLMEILGDDNIIFCRSPVDVTRHGTETKEIYNIQSKVMQRRRVGDYLGMLMHTLDNSITVCPNIPRMRENFSVSNYTHLKGERDEKVRQRVLSYCFMLGNSPNARKIARSINPEVEIPDWHEFDRTIEANAIFYNVSQEQIMNNYAALLHMLTNPVAIEVDQLHWSSDPNKNGGVARLMERMESKKTSAMSRTVLEE
jgi:hypothetical protein